MCASVVSGGRHVAGRARTVAALAALAGAAAFVGSCSYRAAIASCSIACQQDSDCPQSLACSGGLCVAPGSRCDAGISVTVGTGGTGGGGGMGGGSGGSPDAQVDTGPATPTCDAGLRACGGACVDVASAQQSCGACGHSCGGGACNRGVCQPEVLTGAGDMGTSVGVDANDIFFSTDTRVLACPKTGCVLAPRQIASMSKDTSSVLVANGSVFFISAPAQTTTRPTLYICPPAGCPSPVPNVSGFSFSGPSSIAFFGDDVYWLDPDGGVQRNTCAPNGGACTGQLNVGPRGFKALSASDSEIFFADSMADGNGLAKCPRDGCPAAPAAPTKLVATIAPTATGFFGGLVYYQIPGMQDNRTGLIRTCAPTDCSGGNPSNFISGRESPTGMIIDASGVYWIEGVTPGMLAIAGCSLPSCAGGARVLATGVTATALALDDGFVYWANTNNATPGPIMRVAK
jgi:hypothetical protein